MRIICFLLKNCSASIFTCRHPVIIHYSISIALEQKTSPYKKGNQEKTPQLRAMLEGNIFSKIDQDKLFKSKKDKQRLNNAEEPYGSLYERVDHQRYQLLAKI